MGSDEERTEIQALDDLEEMLQSVADELAEWRHRARSAEQEVEALRGVSGAGSGTGPPLAALSEQNQRLSERVSLAREKIGDLVQRLTFLEQQAGEGGSG